jgi:hypothetical protein
VFAVDDRAERLPVRAAAALAQCAPGVRVDDVESFPCQQAPELVHETPVERAAALQFEQPDVGREPFAKAPSGCEGADICAHQLWVCAIHQLRDADLHAADVEHRHEV